jgi:hypothetical protein
MLYPPINTRLNFMNLLNVLRNKIADALALASTLITPHDSNGEVVLPPFKSLHARLLRKIGKLVRWVTPAEDLEADIQRSAQFLRDKRSAKLAASLQRKAESDSTDVTVGES